MMTTLSLLERLRRTDVTSRPRPMALHRGLLMCGLAGGIVILLHPSRLLMVDPTPTSTGAYTETGFPAQSDSAALLRRLRAAQRDLERVRRRTLPWGTGSSGGRCDVRIGRFCYWHDDEDSWMPSPDHEELVRRRDDFLASLDSASESVPADEWIIAQRVRYLVEAERTDRALAVARNCGASEWWCAALQGYVQHHVGAYLAADTTFSAALQIMPEQRRCEWNDLSLLLRGSQRGQYRELACGDRTEFERRFWWLADPFYAVPGNERRSEHYYRVVLNEILEESASPRRMRWGRDNTELLVRFGRTIGWERQRVSGTMSVSDASLIGHHRNGGRQFVSPAEYLDDPTTIAAGHWELDPVNSRSRFALPEFVHYAPIEYQIATFMRGDSVIVVMNGGWTHQRLGEDIAIEAGTGDSAEVAGEGREGTSRTALALVPDEVSEPSIALSEGGTPVSVVVARTPMLASVEVWNARDSVAGRDRRWLDVAERSVDELGVSDILLLTQTDSLPTSLDDAIPHARPNRKLPPTERIDLFWEVYGVDEGRETLHFALSVEKVGKSFLRRAAEWAGIVGSTPDIVRLRWSEEVSGSMSITAHSVGVQLQDKMKGEYAVTLSVRRATGEEKMSARRIEVRE